VHPTRALPLVDVNLPGDGARVVEAGNLGLET